MEKRYDLFQLAPGGFPRWVASAYSLPEAKQKMRQLARLPDGERYLVRDFLSGVIVAYAIGGNQSDDPASGVEKGITENSEPLEHRARNSTL